MCGRFTQHYTWSEIRAFLSVFGAVRNLRPCYNIAPTTDVDVIWLKDGLREIVTMPWGLVPFFWKKGLKDVPATFNARAETVADKPADHGVGVVLAHRPVAQWAVPAGQLPKQRAFGIGGETRRFSASWGSAMERNHSRV